MKRHLGIWFNVKNSVLSFLTSPLFIGIPGLFNRVAYKFPFLLAIYPIDDMELNLFVSLLFVQIYATGAFLVLY